MGIRLVAVIPIKSESSPSCLPTCFGRVDDLGDAFEAIEEARNAAGEIDQQVAAGITIRNHAKAIVK